jgi:ribonuclease VapC
MLRVANVIFDTSVVLALLKGESITELNLPDLRWASMSTVNIAEVCTLLEDCDEMARTSGMRMLGFLRSIEPFDEAQARRAGELRRLGKNISLGDRACLALAIELDANVYTADKAWAAFELPCRIHLIR